MRFQKDFAGAVLINRLLTSNSSNFFTLINHSNSSKTPFQKTRLVVSRGNSSGKQFVM